MPGSNGVVRIATRASDLARWQADHVAALLRDAHGSLSVEIVPVSTEGDRRTEVPLSEMGGKGVFSKEIQGAVLAGEADVAVHSAKDLPAVTPSGLVLAAVPKRGEARDALVGCSLGELASVAGGDGHPVVATGSPRRRVQLAQVVPGVLFEELRGNMATRLAKADRFDAIIVAAVALERLGLTEQLAEVISVDQMVPQVGQGALGVECRSDDETTIAHLEAIEHPASRVAVDAERAFLTRLGGDCSLPAGAYCTVGSGGTLDLVGVLSASVPPTGSRPAGPDPIEVARGHATGTDPIDLGTSCGGRTDREIAGPLIVTPDVSRGVSGKHGPLAGRRVVVTRTPEQAGPLVEHLEILGAQVVVAPAIEITDPSDEGVALRSAASSLGSADSDGDRPDWIVFTSANAVRRFCAVLDPDADLGSTRVAVIGTGTGEAALIAGITVDLVPQRFVAEGLLDAFPDPPPGGGTVWLPRAEVARNVLPEGLMERGWVVEVIPAYRTGTVARDEELAAEIAGADAVGFASASSVDAFVDAYGAEIPPVVAAIGPVTAARARELNLDVAVQPEEHTIAALAHALADYFVDVAHR